MTNKGPGRPKIAIPEEVIQDIIYRYTRDKNIEGKIAYMKIYRYSNELYEKGIIEYNISEYYWRKGKGREAVDKANQVLKYSVGNPQKEDNLVVNTEDAFNKHYTGNKKGKEILIQLLKMNENKLKSKIKENESLYKQLHNRTLELEDAKSKTNYWKDVSDQYQETLFQWAELSVSKENNIANLMTTGKTRSKETERLLKHLFSNEPLEVFIEMSSIIKKKNSSNNSNQVLDSKRKSPKVVSILDDIDF